MAYVPLPSYRVAGGLDFGSLNDSLDFLLKEKARNKLLSDNQAIGAAMYGPGGVPAQTNALLGGRPSPAAQAQVSNITSQYGAPAGAMSPAMAAAAAAGRDYTPDTPEIALIKRNEGFTANTARDYAQNSNGYGTKALPGETAIDRGTAEERLRGEVAPLRTLVDSRVPNANPQQRAALIDAGYNLGAGKGGLADFIPAAAAGDWAGAGNKLLGYDHAGGQRLPGLTSRRAQEAAMLTGGSSPAAPPQQQAALPGAPAASVAAPGPNYDAAIAVAAQQGNIPLAMQLTAAKRQAEETAYDRSRQGRLDERQLANDAQTHQLQDVQIQGAQMALHDKLAMKAAVVAQSVLQAPPEQKAIMAQKLYALHPEFANNLKAHGVDPSDVDQSMNFLIAEARGLSPKEEMTGDMREFNMARQQGFTGTLLDYQTQLKQAGRPQTNVSVSGDKKGAEEMAKLHAKEYEAIRTGANAARTNLANLDALEEGLTAGTQTGAFGETEQGLRKAAAYFGVGNADKVAAGDLISAISNKLALAVRTPNADGGGMPGAMSDADREFLKSTVPGLGRTPEGNRKLIDIARKLGQRSIDIHKLAVTYTKEHDGQLDPGFEEIVNDYADKNPLFAKEPIAPKLQATPKPTGASDADILAEAERAIREEGKDPAMVKQQLEAWGIKR